MDVHHSGYYTCLKQSASKTARKRQQLSGLIKLFWLESDGIYGYRKIHCDLKDFGESCGINRVHRLMKADGLKSQRGYRKPRPHAGTPAVVAVNTLDRQFSPTQPNQLWVTDFTYIRTHEG
ncbi:IS3 family transposase [Acinetobacter sp. 1125_18A]